MVNEVLKNNTSLTSLNLGSNGKEKDNNYNMDENE